MSELFKNIPKETALRLCDLVSAEDGQITSRTLAQNDAVSVTLFAFSAGEEIGTHDSKGDAMVTVLEGTGRYVVGGNEYMLSQGETLIMPANVPHSVHAPGPFKMLLTVVFPIEK